MINKAKEIIEGFINDTLPKSLVDKNLLNLADKRKKICDECLLNINDKCDNESKDKAVIDFDYHGEQRIKDTEYEGCNCWLSKKQKSLSSQCPLGKWENIKL